MNNRDIVGQGWAFPVKPNADKQLVNADGEEKIRQSIWIILSTAPGERQMRPEFGCGIYDLVFEANTVSLRGSIQVRVREALALWEPRIDVLDINVESQPNTRNYILIRIDYRVRSTNSFYNLVYPFFINEGAS